MSSIYFLYPDMSVKEREHVLSNQCAKKEMRNYSRTLSDSEINQEKTQLANDMVSKKKLEEALANLVKDYKAKIKTIDERTDERLERITNRKKTISGTLYGIANQQQGRMMFYDTFGELIDSRELLPDEKQGQLFLTQTNDALKDLPLETAQVVMDITKENEEREAGQMDHEEQPVGEAQQLRESSDNAERNAGELDENHPDYLPFTETKGEQQAESKPWSPTDQTTLANFSHDEDGWAEMTDGQLSAKYGTIDISLIRTMVKVKGKWQAPKGEAKGVVDRLKSNNKDESEQN